MPEVSMVLLTSKKQPPIPIASWVFSLLKKGLDFSSCDEILEETRRRVPSSYLANRFGDQSNMNTNEVMPIERM